MPKKVLEDLINQLTKDDKKILDEYFKIRTKKNVDKWRNIEFEPRELTVYNADGSMQTARNTSEFADLTYHSAMKHILDNDLHGKDDGESHAEILKAFIIRAAHGAGAEAGTAAKLFEAKEEAGDFKSYNEKLEELQKIAEEHLGLNRNNYLGKVLPGIKSGNSDVQIEALQSLKEDLAQGIIRKELQSNYQVALAKVGEWKLRAATIKAIEEYHGLVAKDYGEQLGKKTVELADYFTDINRQPLPQIYQQYGFKKAEPEMSAEEMSESYHKPAYQGKGHGKGDHAKGGHAKSAHGDDHAKDHDDHAHMKEHYSSKAAYTRR